MVLVDWIILGVLIAAALGGLAQGFFRSFCSLAGLIGGLALAAWNYPLVARFFLPIVRVEAIADTIGFLVIALLVMAVANFLGGALAKTVKGMGLGCLDSILGAVFGFFQGAVLIMVCILVILAFFPHTGWLANARLPQYFFAASHVTTDIGPADLAGRVREGIIMFEQDSHKLVKSAKDLEEK